MCVCASLHFLIHVATRGTMFISIHRMQYLKNKSEGKLAIAEFCCHYMRYIIVLYIIQNIMVTFHHNMIFITNTFTTK